MVSLLHRATIITNSKCKNTAVYRLLAVDSLGPHLTQCLMGRGLPLCQVSSWSIQPFGHITPTSQTDRTTVW